MNRYIVARLTQKEYDQMIKIYNWCEQSFDNKKDYMRWTVNYARGNENFVEFAFRQEEDASAFILQWDQYCLTKDQQRNKGIIGWDE